MEVKQETVGIAWKGPALGQHEEIDGVRDHVVWAPLYGYAIEDGDRSSASAPGRFLLFLA